MKKIFITLFFLTTIILTVNLNTFGKYVEQVRVGSFDLTINDDTRKLYLVEGEKFNKLLKKTTSTIVFDLYENYPSFRSRTDGISCGIYLNEESENDLIQLFYDNNNAYVLSEKIIYANPISNALFRNCYSINDIKFNAFDTSDVINAKEMFSSCVSLKTLNISCFATNKIENMEGMFQYCLTLHNIYVSSKWVIDNVKNGFGMFTFCIILEGGKNTRYIDQLVGNRDSYIYAKIDGGKDDPGYFSELV